MSIDETLFNPLDDSLAERVRAYRSVAQALSHAQESVRQVEREGDVSYLGDKEEVESAFSAISQSFKLANQQVSTADLQEAQQQGLLSEDDLVDIVQLQRSQEMTDKRRDKHSSSDSLSFKR